MRASRKAFVMNRVCGMEKAARQLRLQTAVYLRDWMERRDAHKQVTRRTNAAGVV
jgi:hypothetical protein